MATENTTPATETVTANTRKRYDVTDQQVVTIWVSTPSAKGAAAALGMTRTALAARIRVLRKAGVDLPKKTPGAGRRRNTDVAGLNELVKAGQQPQA